ncbi:GAF domain-containing protein [Rhodoferax sp.]|uniref:GAF domain-containing protein n=1 Tax=Rhodoferax sp. TaxID=50421 RepID=UPI00284241B6|nr:GAF domain-containing protein [Rhodoferax sp.]MDR3370343.1 GAF domain-containing protein [Rhodoferax sp.]
MTAHKHDHVQQERLLKLYAALLKCGQAIIRCDQQSALFDEICRYVVELGGVKVAWIGLIRADDPHVWPQSHFGDSPDYLQTIRLSLQAESPPVHDLVSHALQHNQSVWSQDVLNDKNMLALQPDARLHAWRSAVALPLRLMDKPVGVLCIYADQVNAFDTLTRELLEQLASNISNALDLFENDAQRRQVEYALQESEVRYSALFANSCMPMMVVDPATGQIVDANILALDFYGWDKAAFTFMKMTDLNTLTRDQLQHEMALAASAKRSFFESQHRLANGEIRDVEVFSRPVTFDGNPYLMFAIHDASERRRLQAQIHSAQALTQRFIDHLPGIAFVKDSELRLMMVNKQWGETLGVAPETLIGKSAHDIFPAAFADQITAIDQQVLASGQSNIYDEVFDGRHSETSLFVMEDDAGKRFLGGFSVDVTDRYRTNERTRAMLRLNEIEGTLDEKQFLSAGLESAQMLTRSKIGFLHFVNPDQETLELVTWTEGALQGCTAAFDTHYPVSQAGIWADCLRQRQPVIFNDYASYPDKHGLPPGHANLARLVSVPVMVDGSARMLMGVGNKDADYDQHDVETLLLMGNAMWRIVSRLRAERALQRQVNELVQLNRDLTTTQQQLLQSEKMASIGQLAAGVAHEINNPIGFIKSNLGSLADYVDKLLGVARAYSQLGDCLETNDSQTSAQAMAAVKQSMAEADFEFLLADLPELIAQSREGVERVSKIVMDLKNFSRVGESEFQWTDLHVGLESTINVVWNELKYKADVIRDYGDLPRVYCVASQINQVMMNLLVNAAQSMVQRGVITVRTGVQDDQVWLEVQDTGSGIDVAVQARIFEPFYTTKPVGQGTGLGLSIAMGIVKQHQGTLSAQSVAGQGSTFRVTLPVNGGREVTQTLGANPELESKA